MVRKTLRAYLVSIIIHKLSEKYFAKVLLGKKNAEAKILSNF